MNEEELIHTYFANQPVTRDDVRLAIGDDAAVVSVPPGMELVLTTDVLVSGVDFLPETDPVSVGHKALAVNLSDLAAMGAEPRWYTLALTLPAVERVWLESFSAGLFALARRYNLVLVGGDLSRGPLAVAITAYGVVPSGQALMRSGARLGDDIYVTGPLGDAGLALMHQQHRLVLTNEDLAAVSHQLDRPMPRIKAGQRLRGIATAAIDLSDGLVADLGHVLKASGVGARVVLDSIPLSQTYRRYQDRIGWDVAIAHGDDYELCFTAPQAQAKNLAEIFEEIGLKLTRIGEVLAEPGLVIRRADGSAYEPAARGHDHFAAQGAPQVA